MKRTSYRVVTETDGSLSIFEQVTGQCVNPNNYTGWRKYLILWIIEYFFARKNAKRA